MKDFPPLVWLTTEIRIPKCLLSTKLLIQDKETGAIKGEVDGFADAISLTRIALGFNIADISAVPWHDHYGYNTGEGQELNKTAREFGDDPTLWYVSEQPVDVALLTSIWTPRRGQKHRLERNDQSLVEVRQTIALCKARKDVLIPPPWLASEVALAKKM